MHFIVESQFRGGQGADALVDMMTTFGSLPDPAEMGISSRTVYVSASGQTIWTIVEADDLAGIQERFLSLAPWVDSTVTPVLTEEESLGGVFSAIGRLQACLLYTSPSPRDS